MTRRVLHLFPDTNLFIQCRPLSELNWASWGDFDEVHLHVCRPVQKEIDRHKREGNERLARRARLAASIFREILKSGDDRKTVKELSPYVALIIEKSPPPDPSLSDRLEYDVSDDRIVGIVSSFRSLNSNADVRLLTHDTGPLLTAREVGVIAEVIPDEWLLPPTPSEKDKQIAELKEEVARLKRNEPRFEISFDVTNKDESGELQFSQYAPLSDDDVAVLLSVVSTKIPVAETPAFERDAEFNRYLESRYEKYLGEREKWLLSCETFLRDYHRVLQTSIHAQHLCFSVRIENDGTRPGKDVLVRIKSDGEFRIVPHLAAIDSMDHMGLPSAPQFTRSDSVDEFMSSRSPLSLRNLAPIPHTPSVEERDPYHLYWIPNYPSQPKVQLELLCKHWRHGVGSKSIKCMIVPNEDAPKVVGRVKCVVHAENLSEAAEQSWVVRLQARRLSTLGEAKSLIEAFVGRDTE